MNKITISFIVCYITTIFISQAQSDFSSPYSLFGLGQDNTSNFGGYTAMGNTGIASKNLFSINKANPASITSIASSTFLYEIGVSGTNSNKKTTNSSQTNTDFNVSHLAMAFEVKNYWKMNFGLVPYTKVSYEIDLIKPIEGTSLSIDNNISGSGGINEVFWGNGIKLGKNLSVGVELSALFGNINEDEYIDLGSTSVSLTSAKRYFGLGVNTGLQYTFNSILGTETTIGATVSLPTSLSGTEDESGTKSLNGSSSTTILDDTDNDIDNFELPLKIGFGITSIINKSLTVNADFRKNYWTDAYSSNNTYTFQDQEIYGFGVEYQPSKNLDTFWNKLKYRAGANYNSGYLILQDQNIDNYSISLGLGIPLSKSIYSSMLNVNYSYGKEGTINNNLIEDNYHKLSINLSLLGNWFQKEKIY